MAKTEGGGGGIGKLVATPDTVTGEKVGKVGKAFPTFL